MIGERPPPRDPTEDRKEDVARFPPEHPTQARTTGVTRPAPFCPPAPVFYRPPVPTAPPLGMPQPSSSQTLRPTELDTIEHAANPLGVFSPALPAAVGKPVIRGRPFATAARAAAVARKEADLAGKAATEARILSVEGVPAEVFSFAAEATRCAELAETAAVAAEGFKRESARLKDARREAEFRNKGTVVARQAVEWREKAIKALRAAADAAGVTLRQRAPPKRKGSKRKLREVESSSDEDEGEDDARNLQLLAEAGSLETGSPPDGAASGGESQGGPGEVDAEFFPVDSGSHESGGNALVADDDTIDQHAQRARQRKQGARSMQAGAPGMQPSGELCPDDGDMDTPAATMAGPGDWTVAHELLWGTVIQRFDDAPLANDQVLGPHTCLGSVNH